MIKRKATLGVFARRILSFFIFVFLFVVLAIGLSEGRDFSWALKAPIEQRLTAEMGHPVTIEGRIGFELDWTELVIFTDSITTDLGDEASALEASVFAERAGVALGLWELVRGRTDLRGLLLREAEITLPAPDGEAQSDAGDRNPDFIFRALNRLHRITIDNLHLIRLRADANPQVVEVDHLIVAPEGGGLHAAFVGEIQETPYDVDGRIEDLAAFLRFEGSPASMTASIGRNHLEGTGTLTRLWPFEADLELAGNAENVARLFELMGGRLPGAGDGSLTGHLSVAESVAELTVQNLEVRHSGANGEDPGLAFGPARGNLTVTRRGGDRFEVNGTIDTDLVRISPLMAGGTLRENPAPGAEEAERPMNAGLPFAERRIPYRDVRRFSGRVELTAAALHFRDAIFTDVHIPLADTGGTFRIDGARAMYQDRPLTLTFSANAEDHAVHVEAAAHEIPIGRLTEDLGGSAEVHGPAHIAVEGSGTGTTVGEVLETFNGQSNVMIERGWVERGGIDFLAADLLQAFFREGGQDTTPLVCLLNRIDYEDGVGTSRAFLMDTNLITITGQGRVNLARDNINFRLAPRPKDPTLLSLASDYKVEGPILNPSISPEAGGLIRGVATTLGSFALTGGAAALLPLLAGGGEEEMANPCIAALSGEEVPLPDEAPDGEAQGE